MTPPATDRGLSEEVALIISPDIKPDTISWQTAHQAADRVIAHFGLSALLAAARREGEGGIASRDHDHSTDTSGADVAELVASLSEVMEGAQEPCPFCGSESDVVSGHGFYPRCMCCEVVGPTWASKAEAIAAWNRRSPSVERGEAGGDKLLDHALLMQAKLKAVRELLDVREAAYLPYETRDTHQGAYAGGCVTTARAIRKAMDEVQPPPFMLAAAPSPAPSAVEMAGVEEIARAVDPEAWMDSLPVPTRADVESFHARRQASVTVAKRIILALATASREKGSSAARELPLAADMSAVEQPQPRMSKRYDPFDRDFENEVEK